MQNAPLAGCCVESLESKLAPAGTIVLTLAGGVLNIVGDSANNAIAITDVPGVTGPDTPGTGAWTISDPLASGTTFILNGVNQGAGPFNIPAQNSIKANLGGGDDRLDITPSAAPSNMNLTGGLTIDAGAGNDTVNIGTGGVTRQLVIGGAVSVKLGDGNDSLFFSSSAVFNNSVNLQGGAGNDNMSFSGGNVHLFQKGLVVDLGAGDDTFSTISNRFEVMGALSIKGAGLTGASQLIRLAPDHGIVEGAVTIAMAAGDLDLEICTVGSDVFRFGSGITITGGTGNDTVEFDGTTTVGGAVNIDLKNGNNEVTLLNGRTLQAAALNIKGGIGTDLVDVQDNSVLTLAGALSMNLGAGNNTLDINAGCAIIAGSLVLNSLTGDDTITAGGASMNVLGAVTLNLGAGTNAVTLAPTGSAFIGGNFSMTGLAGNDTLAINTPAFRVLGSFTQKLGDGANTTTVQGALFHVAGSLTYTGGKGTDYLLAYSDLFIVNKSLNVSFGEGTGDTLYLAVGQGTVGSVTVKGGSGGDVVALGHTDGATTTRLAILGAVNMSLGTGTSYIVVTDTTIHGTLNVALKGASDQADTFSVNQSTLNGPATLNFGAGVSTLLVNDSLMRGNFTANLGAGNDILLLDNSAGTSAVSTWMGKVTIHTGTGVDTIRVGSSPIVANAGNHFYKNVVINTGVEVDDYLAGNNTMFADSTLTVV